MSAELLFVIFLAAGVSAGLTGVLFKPGVWYNGLIKPSFTPPNWVFPVVWTSIYILSAAAAARVAGVAQSGVMLEPATGLALALWALQIALNTLWTPVFFAAHRMGLGMGVLAALWLVVAAMIVVFFSLDLIAGVLLLPYLAWLSLAAALNWRVWRDNPKV